jgi:hypothetical protein
VFLGHLWGETGECGLARRPVLEQREHAACVRQITFAMPRGEFGERSHAIIHDEARKPGTIISHRKRSERVVLHCCPPMYCPIIESSTMLE